MSGQCIERAVFSLQYLFSVRSWQMAVFSCQPSVIHSHVILDNAFYFLFSIFFFLFSIFLLQFSCFPLSLKLGQGISVQQSSH